MAGPRGRVAAGSPQMLGLSHGELGLVAFMITAILSARFWPRMGEWVALKLGASGESEHERTHDKRG